MTLLMLLIGIIFSYTSLAMGYSNTDMSNVMMWLIALGIISILAVWNHWRWFPPIGLFISLVLSVMGLWMGLSVGWMFSGAVFALVAWDMTDFRQKINLLPAREDIKGMERRHLIRVGVLAVLGLLIGWGLSAWFGN